MLGDMAEHARGMLLLAHQHRLLVLLLSAEERVSEAPPAKLAKGTSARGRVPFGSPSAAGPNGSGGGRSSPGRGLLGSGARQGGTGSLAGWGRGTPTRSHRGGWKAAR